MKSRLKLRLSGRIALFVGIVILIVVGGLGLTAVLLSHNTVSKEAENGLMEASKQGANYIDSQLNIKTSVLSQVAKRIVGNKLEDQFKILAREAEKLGYLDLAILDKDGLGTYAVSGEEVDMKEQTYYQEALSGKASFSDVIVSEADNSAYIMFTVPLVFNESIVGVLAGKEDAAALNDITDQMTYGKAGSAFILGQDGTIYAYADRNYVLGQRNVLVDIKENGIFKDFGLKLEKTGLGKVEVIRYKLENAAKIVATAPIPNTDWTLVLGAPESQITQGVDKLTLLLLIFAAIFLAAGITISVLMGRSISKPIIDNVLVLNHMAQYDMNREHKQKISHYTKRRDEVGIMSNAVLTLQENLRQLIEGISQSAEQLSSASQELSATCQQAVVSSNEVAAAISDMAEGAGDQASDTQKGAGQVDQLGKLIEEDLTLMVDLNAAAENVEQLKEEGFGIIKNLIKKTEQTNLNAQDVQNIIMETNESVNKINEASKMIQNIAGQTNLLALNASIEAARAGEAGRGFTVVADEIRRLADQSTEFSSAIMNDIEQLTQKSNRAVGIMAAVHENIKHQTDSVTHTNAKFDGIAEAIEKVKRSLVLLNQSGIEMGAKKDEIVGIIENLSAVSQENAASTEEASASIEEEAASMNEIANACESLARLAGEMQKGIAMFRL